MNLMDILVKPSIVLAVALAVLPLLRGRSAALRHAVLAAALMCAAVAPVIGLAVPAWRLPARVAAAPSSGDRVGVARTEFLLSTEDPAGRSAAASGTAAGNANPPAWMVARSVWTVGTLLFVGMLIAALGRLGRLAAAAQNVQSGAWVDVAARIGTDYGFRRRVILLQAVHPALLVAWGVLQPKVLLPPSARTWPDKRIRMVLAHELSHIRRGDWLVQLAAELARSLYWFNPLFWLAAAHLRQESEQACDDAVLARGVSGAEYASHLVNIARELQPGGCRLPAPAIVRTSSLERRVRAMLDTNVNRRPLSRRAVLYTMVTLLAITIPVAGFSAAQASATLSGSIIDPTDAALPGVRLVLKNVRSGSEYDVRSDSVGRYEFAGVTPGDYDLTATIAGFSTATVSVTLAAGERARRDVAMQVGSLEETITVAGRSQAPARPGGTPARSVDEQRAEMLAAGCTAAPSKEGTSIGGNLRPPRKLKDVRPTYPEELQSAGVGGTVVLAARIGTDGNVQEVTVVSAPHPDLASAAADAVRGWQFDPTLLNCVAIDVAMKVTVTFDPQR
jgi:TonB family protein